MRFEIQIYFLLINLSPWWYYCIVMRGPVYTESRWVQIYRSLYKHGFTGYRTCISNRTQYFVWDESTNPCPNCTWWRHQMETMSALLAFCAGNSPVTGQFSVQRPVTRRFDVLFDQRLNKRLSKQWSDWWFETPSRPLWRHCNNCNVVRPIQTTVIVRAWMADYIPPLDVDIITYAHHNFLSSIDRKDPKGNVDKSTSVTNLMMMQLSCKEQLVRWVV